MPGRNIVHLVYLDDSRQEAIQDRQFQVISAVIVPDQDFDDIERFTGWAISEHVPEQLRENFEFHSYDLWKRNGAFKNIPEQTVRDMFESWCNIIASFRIPVIYGATNLRALLDILYWSSNPVQVAFQVCAQAVEEWFCEEAHDGLGLFIADKEKNGDANNIKTQSTMFRTFRNIRRSVRASPMTRGRLEHIHDDMYFGDSQFSIGLQLADMCAYLISRHLVGYEDTEAFFKQIEPLIWKQVIEPKTAV